MNTSKIVNYLAGGLSVQEVASIIGCTPAYISQLAQKDDFKSALQAARIDAVEKSDEEEVLENKYLGTENILLDTLKATASMADFRDVAYALKVVSEAKDLKHKQKHPATQGQLNTVNIVQLQIPAHIVPEFKVNSQNEVESVGGKPMAPLSTEGVRNLFANLKLGNTIQQEPTNEIVVELSDF